MKEYLQGDQLIIRCREVHDIARQASETLLEVLSGVTRKQNIYSFKHRVKTSKAIWHKVHRNRLEAKRLRDRHHVLLASNAVKDSDARAKIERDVQEAERFGPDDVLDALGCRYVTLFEEQRLALVRTLFETLEGFRVPPAEDVPVMLINCSIYYTTPAIGSEERAIEIADLLCSSDFARRVISDRSVVKRPIRRTGYSSAHFNFELPVIVDFPRGKEPQPFPQPHLERARLEVQVRDIFEEAWSEAEHYLFYSQKDDFRELSEVEAEAMDSAKRLVDINRGSIDVTRTHISEIKRQLDRVRLKNTDDLALKSTTVRVDDKTEIEAILKGKVSSEIVESLNKAYSFLHDAEAAQTTDEALRKYSDAAVQFGLLRDALGDALDLLVTQRGNMPIRYFVEIELANSLAFSQQPDAAAPARKLYAELSATYPDDPTLRVRYARAIVLQVKLNSDDINQVSGLMKDMPALVRKDRLTGPNHWLLMIAAMLHGYVHFASAMMHEKDGSHLESVQELEAAVNITRQAAVLWRKLPPELKEDETYRLSAFKATSNLIYYLALLVRAGGGGKKGFDAHAIRKQIQETDAIPVKEFRDSYQHLDNKMRGFVAIAERDEALKMAQAIYAILQTYAASRAGRPVDFHEIGHYLVGVEPEPFNAAANVIFSQGSQWTTTLDLVPL